MTIATAVVVIRKVHRVIVAVAIRQVIILVVGAIQVAVVLVVTGKGNT
jgi:hypothetical protein